ncbi:MAG: hypothetical protein ABL999_19545 [Pyrinomonadaceae bacterium]
MTTAVLLLCALENASARAEPVVAVSDQSSDSFGSRFIYGWKIILISARCFTVFDKEPMALMQITDIFFDPVIRALVVL